MDISKYEYQSEFARRYYGQGKADRIAQGIAEGISEVILKQLATRFGRLSQEVATLLRNASPTDLDDIAQRLLSARTLDEALAARETADR